MAIKFKLRDPGSGETHIDVQSRGALSLDEFCAWVSIGRSKVYSEVRAGRLVLRKIGRKSVITVADAEAWLEQLPKIGKSGRRT